MGFQYGEKTRNAARFALEHLLWLISCAGCFYLVMRARTTLLYGAAFLAQYGLDSRYLALIDKVGIVLLGLGAIIFIVLVEYHYMHARDLADLINRFSTMTGVELWSVAILAVSVQAAIGIRAITLPAAVLFGTQLLGGTAMITSRSWSRRLFRSRRA